MEEVKQQLEKLIEAEFWNSLNKGFLNSTEIVNKIWKMLSEKKALNKTSPEPAYGCFENFDE